MSFDTNPYTKKVKSELINGDVNILAQCAETEDELNMFESETLQDLIAFKWDNYGYKFHLFGCCYHFVYIIILFLYTDQVYIRGGVPGLPTPEDGRRMLRGGGEE